jgi:hypothetical protein
VSTYSSCNYICTLNMYLKWVSHEIFRILFWDVWIGLYKNLWLFLIFSFSKPFLTKCSQLRKEIFQMFNIKPVLAKKQLEITEAAFSKIILYIQTWNREWKWSWIWTQTWTDLFMSNTLILTCLTSNKVIGTFLGVKWQLITSLLHFMWGQERVK